jgi:hypothetical protein
MDTDLVERGERSRAGCSVESLLLEVFGIHAATVSIRSCG